MFRPNSSSSLARLNPAPGNSPGGQQFGINNFLYGEHGFRSAEELQFYLGRIGGEGSIVTITDALHVQVGGPNRSLTGTGNDRTNNNPATGARNSPPAGSNSGTAASRLALSPTPPRGLLERVVGDSVPPPGYERNSYVVMCGLHRRENTTFGRTGVESWPSGRDNLTSFVQITPCDICQGCVMEDGRGSFSVYPRTRRN